MLLATKFGDWEKTLSGLVKASSRLEESAKKALKQEAQFLRTQMVKGITDQAPGGQQFKPLSPTTLAVRKFMGFSGTKALIRRGDLRNSIAVTESEDGLFIGIHRTAKNRDGSSLVDIAAMNEFGSGPIVIQITPKMRRFLMAAFREAGLAHAPQKSTGMIVIKIPPRPFVGPIYDKFGGVGSRDRIEKSLGNMMSEYLLG